MTLKKWQEIGLPLTTPHSRSDEVSRLTDRQPVSVFEEGMDVIEATETNNATDDAVRWKYKGPWLEGMTEGEFNTYIQKQIRGRKLEFQTFLRKELAQIWTEARIGAARAKGEDIPPPVDPADILPGELNKYIKTLRDEDNQESRNKMICRFLDLPPLPTRKADYDSMKLNDRRRTSITVDQESSRNPFKESGPPKTHPSAGLSYTRTTSVLMNHPKFGPQANATPVPARLVKPTASAVDTSKSFIGVAGFLTNDPNGFGIKDFRSTSGQSTRYNKTQNTETNVSLKYVDLDSHGGTKGWVHPRSAYVDIHGKIKLIVDNAHPDALRVKEGKTHEIPDIQETLSSVRFRNVLLNPQSRATRLNLSLFPK